MLKRSATAVVAAAIKRKNLSKQIDERNLKKKKKVELLCYVVGTFFLLKLTDNQRFIILKGKKSIREENEDYH